MRFSGIKSLKRIVKDPHGLGKTAGAWLLRIASALLVLLLTFFCFYHFSASGNGEIRTMLLTEDRVETTSVGEAVIFRSEQALEPTNRGLTVPAVSEGAHVAKDTVLAQVYRQGAELGNAYRALSARLAAVEAAASQDDALSDLEALRTELRELSLAAVEQLDRGDAAAAILLSESLRLLSERIRAVTENAETLSELREALRAEKARLLSEAGDDPEALRSPVGGYYYPYADANYTVCASDRVANLTGADYLSITETLRLGTAERVAGGTLVTEAEWYLAVSTELSADAIARLTVGGEYEVIFPENGDVRIPMTLRRTVMAEGDAPSLLILSTLRIPDGFSFDRLQTVHVVTGSLSGFSVPKEAIHTLDGNSGVYVLEGNIVYFRRVEVLHDLGVRYLVKTTDPTPGGEFTQNTYQYVALYDAVILSGTRLFHGRVLS